MRYDSIGMGFLKIAALLYASRFVAAGAFMGGTNTWARDVFQGGYYYVGSQLTVLAGISAALGIIALGIGFIKAAKKQRRPSDSSSVSTDE